MRWDGMGRMGEMEGRGDGMGPDWMGWVGMGGDGLGIEMGNGNWNEMA